MRRADTLVFIPTYNERENVERLVSQICGLGMELDILFIDDSSTDGTALILREMANRHSRLKINERPTKMGIGSAHQDALAYAYDNEYQFIVTMDSDFTHSPYDIPRMLLEMSLDDVTVGSRYLLQKSLPGWSLYRRMLTWMGHFMTVRLLGLPNDASGAFRCYNLRRIPRELFGMVKSHSYSFFFESLFVLRLNGMRIGEIPIVLPARTYGHSKMKLSDAAHSLRTLVNLFVTRLRTPEQFLLDRPISGLKTDLNDPQNWDLYWNRPKSKTGVLYDLVAAIYRQGIIKRNLNHVIRTTFMSGSRLLHAGCGSGQVDVDLQREMRLTAVDISLGALRLYARNNPLAQMIEHANIFKLPYPDEHFDGIYNLGVMEHFTEEEIVRILLQFNRVIMSGGKIVLFWPHRRATSVMILRFIHFMLNCFSRKSVQLHPAEITYISSKEMAKKLLSNAGFKLIQYHFTYRDMFVQAVLIAEKS